MPEGPVVSILTPVYNGEPYLQECIESVLNQSYQNFEYIIVNNCSTDRTLEIAREFAKKDSRIRVHDNENFLDVIANHNLAFQLISTSAKYCKVVSADDYLLRECLLQMVEFAEANPSAAIIGSYQLCLDRVLWQGFEYPRAVFPGRDVCRQVFLGNVQGFGFGSPTSLLYRADVVNGSANFYPNSSPHADTSACFKHLRNSFFGFVYQVLSYNRAHTATQSAKSLEFNRYAPAYLNDLIVYGPYYLDENELQHCISMQLRSYYRFLAMHHFAGSRDKEFWDYHNSRLQELGYPLSNYILLKAALIAVVAKSSTRSPTVAKMRNILWRYPGVLASRLTQAGSKLKS
jgi:glycosyltransferase involved in cell wall biosynthesis